MQPELLSSLNDFGYDIMPFLNKAIILDSGPLLLYLGGLCNPSQIGKNKLTKEYTKDEFELLVNISSLFPKILVTPQILAEISNLINRDVEKHRFHDYMVTLNDYFKKLSEEHIDKDILLNYPEFSRLGFTDVSIMDAAKNGGNLILTKDLNLEIACHNNNIPVVHFDKIRPIVW